MEDSGKKSIIKVDPRVFFGTLQDSVKKKKLLNPTKNVQMEELPSMSDVLLRHTTPGTIFSYPGKSIVFKDSTQQAVKSLEVTFNSTQGIDMALLHQLHIKVRDV